MSLLYWYVTYELWSYEECRMRHGFTMPPARFAAVESRRVVEGGIALTGCFTELTVHCTPGTLMQVGT